MKTNYVAVRDLYHSQDTVDIMKELLPDMISLDRLTRVALTVVRTNDKLMSCHRDSLLSCLIGCGQLGLSPDPYLGQAYFVPFWSSKRNAFEATLIPGYKGLITLARRTGHVADVDAMIVHWNDDFKAVKGLEPQLEHIENEKDPGEFRGAWAMFRYQTSGWQPTWQYLSKAKVDRHMAMTKSKDKSGKVFGPWVDHYDSMALKTAIRVTSKLVPMSVEEQFTKAVKAEDMALAGLGQTDMFLPAGHASIATRDYDAEIEELVKNWDGREKVFEFISVAAAETGKDPFELKKMLLEGDKNLVRNFGEGFDSYLATSADSKMEADSGGDWEAWRKEWINLRKLDSFQQYFENNLETIYGAPVELKARFAQKFTGFFSVEFPDDIAVAKNLISIGYVLKNDSGGVENTEGGSKGEGEKTSPTFAVTPEDADLDHMIEYLKNHFPRVWIDQMRGVKPEGYQAKIDAICQIGGMVELKSGSFESELLGACVRYLISRD